MGEQLSTEEILALIRAGSSRGDSSAPPEPDALSKPRTPAEAAAEPEAEVPADDIPATASAASSGPAPKGAANILASIRASGGGSQPAADVAAAKPTAPKPGSTADILAAVRGGGASAATPAKKKAAAAAAMVAPDPATASGLSVADMIRAARAGVSPEEAEVKPKPVLLPSKPLTPFSPPKSLKEAASERRRGFLSTLFGWICSPVVLAWTSLSAVSGIAGLATARFMMPNVLVEPPTRFKIGPPTDYSPGTVSTKWKAQFGIWIVNADVNGVQMIYALSTVCTHLGCTPNWLEGEQKFKCPCHGSGFRMTGINFEGPAPRPLERMGIRLAPDGMLEVDKSVKFQQELDQWENSASFVSVV